LGLGIMGVRVRINRLRVRVKVGVRVSKTNRGPKENL
jgi:hypothetical protein